MRAFLRRLGPGLITGAADDDPSGIGTYSQAGAKLGFGLLWTIWFTFPLMTAAQEISARIGRVTGCGLAANLRRHYPRWLLLSMLALLFIANTVNLGADLAAMGEAVTLIAGGNAHTHAVVLALASVFLQIAIPYHRYVSILKWLTLSLFAYVATAFAVNVPWGEALRAMALPKLHGSGEFWSLVTAVFGTTISPYLFFWQASQEREELQLEKGARPLREAPGQAPAQFARIHIDTITGMGFSNLVAFFIMLTTAVVLNQHGQTEIASAEAAAQALRPLAGRFAFALFSLGILGTGLLAVPVLAGSSAFAIGEALRWPVGMEEEFRRARGFYSAILLSVLLALGMLFAGISPIRALFLSAVINGVIAGPILAMMVWMACDKKVMGHFTLPTWLRWGGWITTTVMIGAAVVMFATL